MSPGIIKIISISGTFVRWTWDSNSHNVVKVREANNPDIQICTSIPSVLPSTQTTLPQVDSKDKYDNCTLIDGQLSVAKTQTHNYTANTLGTHYFVCGVGNHCANGTMKATVEVKEECP